TGITFLATTSVLNAFEYTDRPPGSVSTPSQTNPPTVNPPGRPSTNPPGKGSVSQPGSSQNSIRQNTIQENATPSNPASTVNPSSSSTPNNYNTQNTSSSNYRHANPYHNTLTEADVRTHTGALVDDDIVQKVRWGIMNDKTISDKGKSIQISVTDGEVTLIGNVANESDKNKIESIVKQIEGVKKINSKLSVSGK
ncbi:BON domain-containing protein, partial [Parachlamydia acanthamoebae]